MSERYALGDPVTFTWALRRVSEYRDLQHAPRGSERWKVWQTDSYPGQPTPAPRRGIVIGVRTLANGPTESDYEYGTSFDAARAERFTAYLIAFDLRKRPVLVLPEHINP